MNISLKRLPHGEGLSLPAYATEGAAAMDICSAQDLTLTFMTPTLVKTGFSISIPIGYEIQVRPRSGLSFKHGIMVVNSPGTIDSDYRGEICVIMMNTQEEPFKISRGDRIAQLILSPVVQAQVKEVDMLDETKRGANGFGSTGRN